MAVAFSPFEGFYLSVQTLGSTQLLFTLRFSSLRPVVSFTSDHPVSPYLYLLIAHRALHGSISIHNSIKSHNLAS